MTPFVVYALEHPASLLFDLVIDTLCEYSEIYDRMLYAFYPPSFWPPKS